LNKARALDESHKKRKGWLHELLKAIASILGVGTDGLSLAVSIVVITGLLGANFGATLLDIFINLVRLIEFCVKTDEDIIFARKYCTQ